MKKFVQSPNNIFLFMLDDTKPLLSECDSHLTGIFTKAELFCRSYSVERNLSIRN